MRSDDGLSPMRDLAARTREVMKRQQARPTPRLAEPAAPQVDPEQTARARRERATGWAPARFRDASLADLPAEVRGPIEAWAADPGDRNLVVAGPVGSGKSHAVAAALLTRYTLGDAEARFRWTATTTLLERERPDADEDDGPSLAVCRAVPMLALDDLGAERETEWGIDRMTLLVSDRWDNGRPMAVTTNLALGPEGPLAARYGERTYSRLVGGAVVVRLTGIDRRRGR